MKRRIQKRLRKVRRLPRGIRRRSMRGHIPRRCPSLSVAEVRSLAVALYFDDVARAALALVHHYVARICGGRLVELEDDHADSTEAP